MRRNQAALPMVLCALFCALTAAGAFLKIPVPLVPFTLQFLFTTLAGLLLGPGKGALSVGAYVLLGLMGVPVFAGGGGPGYVLQPTFGYLIGFIASTAITGALARRWPDQGIRRLLWASFAGLAAVYAIGMAYYYCIMNFYTHSPVGIGTVFLYCFVLAAPGDCLLCFLAAGLAARLLPILKKAGCFP